MPALLTNKYFIGIDLGTGSVKAVALDNDGKTLASSQYFYPTLTPQPGLSEQEPEAIWHAFVQCVNELIAQMKSAPAAISFSSAMHSIMPVNVQGQALANAILWADARSAEIAAAIRESADGEMIYQHTGTAIYAMSPLCKIIWLRQNRRELFATAHKFISIKEYIWFKLFSVFEVDHSTASATGMLDIINLSWYDPSLQLAGITERSLSTPVSTTSTRYLAKENRMLVGIDTSTLFVIGASDGCCANLGGNAIRAGIAAITIGTSGAVRVGSSMPAYNYKAMTFNYLLDEKTFICGGAVNNGGAAVDWLLKDFLNLEHINRKTYDGLFSAIETVDAGSNGLLFLPYLHAERAPVWDAKSSGAFVGINFKHKQPHFLRAVLEGICFALYDVLHAVEESSFAVKEIVVSGGFVSSPVWVQILADITGKKLTLLQGGDSSAVGAVYLAMKAMGIDIQPILNASSEQCTVVEPNLSNHKIYTAIFPVYKKLYTDLKTSMHQLNALKL